MVAAVAVGVSMTGCSTSVGDPQNPLAQGNGPLVSVSPAPRILVVPTTTAPTGAATDKAGATLSPLPTAPGIPTEVDATGALGQWLRVQGVRVRVDRVRFDPCLSDLFPAGPGRTYALVDVQGRNDEYPGSPGLGPINWTLEYDTAAGPEHANAGIVGCRDFPSTGGPLVQGSAASTTLAIEIPGDARDMVLVYSGMVFFSDGPRVRIALGR